MTLGSLGQLIAKFVVSKPPTTWHGYPIMPSAARPKDIPVESVLQKWSAEKLFSRAKIKKIVRGQQIV